MIKRWRIAAVVLAIVCASASAAEPGGAEARMRTEIASMASQWNRGDLEGALQGYCPSSDISWVNASGLSHGYEPFARSMREEFARSPASMGTMSVELLESRDLGGGSALAVVRWSITRDGRRLMGGISSQLWAECAGRMRIVFERAS